MVKLNYSSKEDRKQDTVDNYTQQHMIDVIFKLLVTFCLCVLFFFVIHWQCCNLALHKMSKFTCGRSCNEKRVKDNNWHFTFLQSPLMSGRIAGVILASLWKHWLIQISVVTHSWADLLHVQCSCAMHLVEKNSSLCQMHSLGGFRIWRRCTYCWYNLLWLMWNWSNKMYEGSFYMLKVNQVVSQHVLKHCSRQMLIFQQPWKLDRIGLQCTVQVDIWTTFKKKFWKATVFGCGA